MRIQIVQELQLSQTDRASGAVDFEVI